MPYLTHRQAQRDILAHWRQTLPAIPAGAMFPTTATVVPTNWSIVNWSSPRALKIYGVGDHLDTDSGGTLGTEVGQLKRSLSITDAGGHSGTLRSMAKGALGMGALAESDHNHGGAQVEAAVPLPDRLGCRMLKASIDLDDLPEKAIWLAYDALTKSGWSREYNSANPMESALYAGGAGAAISWYGFESSKIELPATSGTHGHGSHAGNGSGSGTNDPEGGPAGNHLHGNTTINYSYFMRAHVFNAWINYTGSKAFREGNLGVHAFWEEGHVPPEGWALFLPDGIGCFATLAYAQANGGLYRSGNSLISATGVTPTSGAHAHYGGDTDTDTENARHIDTVGDHFHTFSYGSQLYKPPRIYLHIIKRLW